RQGAHRDRQVGDQPTGGSGLTTEQIPSPPINARVSKPICERFMATRVRKTVAAQRKVQQEIARADRARKSRPKEPKHRGAVQAGARRYPEPPWPPQHQAKPGSELALDPAPMFDAPFYRGSGKLEDKVAVITGGDSGIGRSVALLFAREGADVALVYLSESRDA